MLTSTPKEGTEKVTTRKNPKSVKYPAKDLTTPRRKSLGPNHKLKEPKEKNGAMNKLMRKVRKSLAPGDIPTLANFKIDDIEVLFPELPVKKVEAQLVATEQPDVEQVEAKKVEAEQVDAQQLESVHVEEPMDVDANQQVHRELAMKFEPSADYMSDYWSINNNIDLEMTALGGMIKLHQYCYKEFAKTKDAIYRDAANFFRSADMGCLLQMYQIPLRVVYLNHLSCATVEPWYRDYYSARDINRANIGIAYDQDKFTYYDELFDDVGRDAYEMMTMEMKKLEDYCLRKSKATKMPCYFDGVQFWKKALPNHLPRNYQLVLMLSKKQNWNIEVIEKWFRMLYTNDICSGGRAQDIYPSLECGTDRLI